MPVKPTKRRFMTPEECEQYGVPLGTEGPVDAGPDYEPGYLSLMTDIESERRDAIDDAHEDWAMREIIRRFNPRVIEVFSDGACILEVDLPDGGTH